MPSEMPVQNMKNSILKKPEIICNDEHKYFVDGTLTPGFSEVMDIWHKDGFYYVNKLNGMKIPAHIMEQAQDHGSAVHKGAHFVLTGKGIKRDKIHPDLENPFNELDKWRKEYDPQFILIETPIYSKKLNLCCTPDIICKLNIRKIWRTAVVEIKTGAYDLAPAQLCVQEQVFKDWEPYRGTVLRYILSLPKKGGFKFIQDFENFSWGFGFFKSRQFQYNYLRRK